MQFGRKYRLVIPPGFSSVCCPAISLQDIGQECYIGMEEQSR